MMHLTSDNGATPSLPMETERRWKVPVVPEWVLCTPAVQIRQGYLSARGETPEVRIRAEGEHFEITIKGSGTLTRMEIPIPLSEQVFQKLWPGTEGERIHKARYKVRYGEHEIHVDLYEQHPGLVTAEVEFLSASAAAAFIPPEWFGEELTENPRFRNRSLAC